MPSPNEPPLVAIACQGGGSHAAFGAGVFHRLLEDLGEKFRLAAVSGTSGGAVNAALAWSGLIRGGEAGGVSQAQARLEGLWKELGAREFPDVLRNLWGQFYLGMPFTFEVSPYEWDLGAAREMRTLLEKWLKLEELPKDAEALNRPALFVGATDIRQGVSVAIGGDGRTVSRMKGVELPPEPFGYEDVMASVAIPPLYKEVERRGTAFWDGLFSINPPINVLTNLEPRPDEIWVIQINPQVSMHKPIFMRDIADRRNELSGNVSMNKELDMIESVNAMISAGHLKGTHYRPITVRIVGIEEADPGLNLASKFDRDPALLGRLFELGRSRAPAFYEPNSDRDAVVDRLKRMASARK